MGSLHGVPPDVVAWQSMHEVVAVLHAKLDMTEVVDADRK